MRPSRSNNLRTVGRSDLELKKSDSSRQTLSNEHRLTQIGLLCQELRAFKDSSVYQGKFQIGQLSKCAGPSDEIFELEFQHLFFHIESSHSHTWHNFLCSFTPRQSPHCATNGRDWTLFPECALRSLNASKFLRKGRKSNFKATAGFASKSWVDFIQNKVNLEHGVKRGTIFDECANWRYRNASRKKSVSQPQSIRQRSWTYQQMRLAKTGDISEIQIKILNGSRVMNTFSFRCSFVFKGPIKSVHKPTGFIKTKIWGVVLNGLRRPVEGRGVITWENFFCNPPNGCGDIRVRILARLSVP